MKCAIRTVLGPLAVFAGAHCVGRAFQGDQGTMRHVTPLTMVVSETADSGAIESQRMVAVRSDGARLAVSLPGRNHSPYDPRNLTIPKEGKRIVLWDRLRMMSTYYLDPETAANSGWVRVHPECLTSIKPEARVLGREMLLGLAAFRYGWDTRVSGTDLQKDQVWVAPEADCQQLKFVSEIWRGETMVNRFDRTVISLTKGEPPKEWFIPPAGYREVKPSEASIQILERKSGKPFDSAGDSAAKYLAAGHERLDNVYLASQRHKR